MTNTRSNTSLGSVLNAIAGKPDSIYHKMMAECDITEVADLMLLNEEDIKELEYEDGDANIIKCKTIH